MKTRKILAIAIITIMFLALFIGTVSAITLPALTITSNTYAVGDKMTKDEVTTVKEDKSLQLNAIITHGNEMMVDGDPNTIGQFVDKINPTGVTWTSSDTTVATVNSVGRVTGVKAGTAKITATTTDETADTKTAEVTITVTAPEFTDFSNVTFNVEEVTKFDSVTITYKNFTPLENHTYIVLVEQDASYTFDPAKEYVNCGTISYDEEKKTYFTTLPAEYSRKVAEETKDAYLVVIDKEGDTYKSKMVLKPTKIQKPTIKANLGGGYLESFHVNTGSSNFYNTVRIADERKVTYKLGEVTDNSILNSISKEESGAFTKLLTYAKADSNPLTTGSFNFAGGSYDTANVARATGKISADKYYYVYEVADTVNGKYVPIEDVVVFNGSTDGVLVHFAFAGSQSSDPYTADGNTTVPTNVTGDNSIATKKIPQTGATPVFMIVLGSAVLVAGVFVVANKKYRDIK